MWRVLLLTCFVILVQEGHSFTGRTECPESEDIQPCYCYFLSGHAYMSCNNFTDPEALRRIFTKSQGYEFIVVVIKDSILEYLPHEILDSVQTRELQVKKTTLKQAYDRMPIAVDSVHDFIIDNISIERGNIWHLIQPLESLRYLYIIDQPIEILGRDFSDHVTKQLVALSLYKTETREISPGTFAKFRRLAKIEVDGGQIDMLTRDIFPTPFYGRHLYFNNQRLREIPDGLFYEMPNLSVVGFKKNQIVTFSEKAFDRDISGKVAIFLDENPLKCDCQMIWVIQKKPQLLQGECESPQRLHGKELNKLTIEDFNC